MQAIILAGGFGTRLRSVVSDVPKPMAPVQGKPFLHYVLRYLQRQGIYSVILSVGYLHEKVMQYFGQQYGEIRVSYHVESEPLGTGGAIRHALSQAEGDYVLVVNGDTLFTVDLNRLRVKATETQADVIIAGRVVDDIDRYGFMVLDGDRVLQFSSYANSQAQGVINGGVYLLRREIFRTIDTRNPFSFETEFLSKVGGEIDMRCVSFSDYFIDIGVPEDYRRALVELK